MTLFSWGQLNSWIRNHGYVSRNFTSRFSGINKSTRTTRRICFVECVCVSNFKQSRWFWIINYYNIYFYNSFWRVENLNIKRQLKWRHRRLKKLIKWKMTLCKSESELELEFKYYAIKLKPVLGLKLSCILFAKIFKVLFCFVILWKVDLAC